jgi:hypothetical protein
MQAWDPHLPRDPYMRKTIPLILVLWLSALWLVACGGSGGGFSGTPDQPSISISPMNPNMLVGQSMQFTANIQNLSDTRVAWSVREENGGTIASTDTGGIYTAPWPVGIYHVVATAVADSSLTTNTMVSVTAKFAFLEEYPSGDALPFSMTPMLGAVGTDGSIGIGGVIDQGTGKPVSVAMESLTLSSDGTKGTFDVVAPDLTYDVYIANAVGTGSATQLTQDGHSWWPQFSADGKQILYMRDVNNWSSIWMMNTDGSNQHEVFSAEAWGVELYSATLSPDATRIAAELTWNPNGVWQDGIVIMNVDGTNPTPLTGANIGCMGYDEMPAFSNDGTQIMFSRWCGEQNGNESMYTINTDGTGLARLGTAALDGIWNYNPLPVGDSIVFQSNQAAPSTDTFEIYTMKADGSGVTKLTNNVVYDGFDLSKWQGPPAANAQRVFQSFRASHPALRASAQRAEKIKNLQQNRR